MDGYWFQSIEKSEGMDSAMQHDRDVWHSFARTEALRIRNYLHLEEHPGLEGLKKALQLRYNNIVHNTDIEEDSDYLIFRVVDCSVQVGRQKKGLDFHPCLSAGIIEYTVFAKTIDDMFEVSAVSCFPEVTDPTCCCSWKFELKKKVFS